MVMCGPHGLRFNHPVELRLPHCASMTPDGWSFALKSSDAGSAAGGGGGDSSQVRSSNISPSQGGAFAIAPIILIDCSHQFFTFTSFRKFISFRTFISFYSCQAKSKTLATLILAHQALIENIFSGKICNWVIKLDKIQFLYLLITFNPSARCLDTTLLCTISFFYLCDPIFCQKQTTKKDSRKVRNRPPSTSKKIFLALHFPFFFRKKINILFSPFFVQLSCSSLFTLKHFFDSKKAKKTGPAGTSCSLDTLAITIF